MHEYAKFDQNIQCGSKVMNIVTNTDVQRTLVHLGRLVCMPVVRE